MSRVYTGLKKVSVTVPDLRNVVFISNLRNNAGFILDWRKFQRLHELVTCTRESFSDCNSIEKYRVYIVLEKVFVIASNLRIGQIYIGLKKVSVTAPDLRNVGFILDLRNVQGLYWTQESFCDCIELENCAGFILGSRKFQRSHWTCYLDLRKFQWLH